MYYLWQTFNAMLLDELAYQIIVLSYLWQIEWLVCTLTKFGNVFRTIVNSEPFLNLVATCC